MTSPFMPAGHIECPHCHGYGSSLKDEGDGRCSRCGGSGTIPDPKHEHKPGDSHGSIDPLIPHTHKK